MSLRNIVSVSLVLSGFALLPLMGCGGAECGEGTTERDGECVLEGTGTECDDGEVRQGDQCVDAGLLCGENTSYDDGVCVADESADCGEGTELEPNSNTCVPTGDGASCGAGTAVTTDGECLPTAEVCREGTSFDESSRLCLPDEQCQEGDVALDGFCVSNAQYLAAMADVEANENSNPALDGEVNDLEVKGLGELTVFTGTILAPTDVNDDGELDQHIDYFAFEADAGDWFEISVQSLGMPTPHFNVWSVEDDELSLWRSSTAYTGKDKMRQVVVPTDGTYIIEVMPESLLQNDRLIGGDDWAYVGTLELVEAPDATSHSFEENLEGSIGRLDDNFFLVDEFEADTTVILNWEITPSDASQVVQVWNSPTDFVGEFSDTASFEVQESGEFYLIVDWIEAFGSLGHDYEISGEEQVDIEAGDHVDVEFTAQDGDVLELVQFNQNGAFVGVTITPDGGDALIEEIILDERNNGTGDSILRYVDLDAGDYTIRIINPSAEDTIEGFSLTRNIISPDPITDLDATYSGSGSEWLFSEQNYYVIELDETTTVRMTLENLLTGSDDGGVIASIYQSNARLIETPEAWFNMGVVHTVEFTFEENARYVIHLGHDYTTFDGIFEYELTFAEFAQIGTELFSIGDGEIAEIVQSNNEDQLVTIVVTDNDNDQEVLNEPLSPFDKISLTDLEGDFTVEAWSFDTFAEFELLVDVRTMIHEDLGTLSIGETISTTYTDSVEPREDIYYTVILAEELEIDYTVTGTSTGDDAEFRIYQESDLNTPVFTDDSEGDLSGSTPALAAGTYVLKITNFVLAEAMENGFSLTLDGVDEGS